jgi:hypothetical protein
VEQDRRHASSFENDPTTARRFRQLAGDRLWRRRRLALVNELVFPVENANIGLYAPIPPRGPVALFSLEQIVNGLRHGFEPPRSARAA